MPSIPHFSLEYKMRRLFLSFLAVVALAAGFGVSASAAPRHLAVSRDTVIETSALNFTQMNPCTGENVTVSGVTRGNGWTSTSVAGDTVERHVVQVGDDSLAAVGASGQRYSVVYYLDQYTMTVTDSLGTSVRLAHVHKFWYLVNGASYKSFLFDQDYDLTNPPFKIVYNRNEKTCNQL